MVEKRTDMFFKKLLAVVLVLMVGSCMESSSPRPVAEKFLEAMRTRDYQEAAEYGTQETGKLLKQLERIESLQSGEQRPEMGKFKIVSEEIQGKNATVFFTEEGVPEEQKISLKKITSVDASGKQVKEWKVSLRKEELPIPVLPETIDPTTGQE
jgi:hypothetical protein